MIDYAKLDHMIVECKKDNISETFTLEEIFNNDELDHAFKMMSLTQSTIRHDNDCVYRLLEPDYTI